MFVAKKLGSQITKKNVRYYSNGTAPPARASKASPPDISGLLTLKLKYGNVAPPKKEYDAEMKKYIQSIGLIDYVKKIEGEKKTDPFLLEVEKYKKTPPSEFNTPEKLAAKFPLIAKRFPWPTEDEARIKGAAIFGLKGTESAEKLPTLNLWEQWQKDKLALFDTVQESLEATDDASYEADTPFFQNYPSAKSYLPEDLALLTPEIRGFVNRVVPSYSAPKFDDSDERLARKFIGEQVSRELEIAAGELYNSSTPVDINPFEDKPAKE